MRKKSRRGRERERERAFSQRLPCARGGLVFRPLSAKERRFCRLFRSFILTEDRRASTVTNIRKDSRKGALTRALLRARVSVSDPRPKKNSTSSHLSPPPRAGLSVLFSRSRFLPCERQGASASPSGRARLAPWLLWWRERVRERGKRFRGKKIAISPGKVFQGRAKQPAPETVAFIHKLRLPCSLPPCPPPPPRAATPLVTSSQQKCRRRCASPRPRRSLEPAPRRARPPPRRYVEKKRIDDSSPCLFDFRRRRQAQSTDAWSDASFAQQGEVSPPCSLELWPVVQVPRSPTMPMHPS